MQGRNNHKIDPKVAESDGTRDMEFQVLLWEMSKRIGVLLLSKGMKGAETDWRAVKQLQ